MFAPPTLLEVARQHYVQHLGFRNTDLTIEEDFSASTSVAGTLGCQLGIASRLDDITQHIRTHNFVGSGGRNLHCAS